MSVTQTLENTYPWRTGRKVGRTIYMQAGREPSDGDPLIGVMDSPEIAAEVVRAHNSLLGAERWAEWVRPAIDDDPEPTDGGAGDILLREARDLLDHLPDHLKHPERCPACSLEDRIDAVLGADPGEPPYLDDPDYDPEGGDA